jgi:uncharacterized membrane protein (DUF485 family)
MKNMVMGLGLMIMAIIFTTVHIALSNSYHRKDAPDDD